MSVKYISEIPYDSITDNQVELSTESSKDSLYRTIRDGSDNVLVEYRKENSGAFNAYDQLRDPLNTLRLKSAYNNLGLNESRLVEIRSTDIELANNGNIAFNGEVTDVIIASGGGGYSAAELYTDDTYGSGFNATYTVDSTGIIDSITVINSGSGYVTPPTLLFTVNSKTTSTATLIPIMSASADTNNKLVLPLQLRDSGVTAGSYTATDITVDSTGRITSASSGSGGGSTLTQEQVEDYAGSLVATGGTKTGIAVTYQDGTGDMDFVVDDATKLLLIGGAMTGAITTNSTFDGVDIATRDAILTSTTLTANACLPKAGGTMSGNVDMGDARFTNAQRVGFNDGGYITAIVDNDDMSDVSAVKIASSESVKAYVDNNVKIKVATVTLTLLQMNNLHSTPITIVAAQGSNKVIVPTSGMLWVDRDGSTAQVNTACDLWVGYDGGTSSTTTMYYIRRFMYGETGDRLWHLQSTGETGQSLTAGDNVPLTVAVDSAVTSGSIDSMKVSVSYYVFDNS